MYMNYKATAKRKWLQEVKLQPKIKVTIYDDEDITQVWEGSVRNKKSMSIKKKGVLMKLELKRKVITRRWNGINTFAIKNKKLYK